ncbi:ATP-binding protein [Heliorestis acidaminivorans]|uniref:ATP-binding protein n=1 Tax=Heliorestis acidaminivorans TaxID=553427 RepID=A0A6I0F1D2_9FIRM|nr:hypothetical protein [Heliorestis acidaminivorans]KAB2952144.1 ATP-binding protein [Heliorestis acidaminivorans]
MIDKFFDSGFEAVIVQGDEDYGKTTLLAQYANEKNKSSISLFIKPSSRFTYDPEFLKLDLYRQIEAILENDISEIPDNISDSLIRQKLFKLQGLIRNRKKKLHFIIDGLDEIPQEDIQVKEQIINILPLGMPDIYFVFSAKSYNVDSFFLEEKRINYKDLPLVEFTLGEAISFLRDLMQEKLIKDITKIYKRVPGRLASIRRIIIAGESPKNLLVEVPEKLFQVEWKTVERTDELQNKILSIIVHDKRKHYIKDLAKILNTKTDLVLQKLEGLSFVEIDKQNEEVSFVSESYRLFAAQQLAHLKDYTNSIIIDYLLKEPAELDSLLLLPNYFASSERHNDLLNYLSSEILNAIVSKTQSISLIKQISNLGIEAAASLEKDDSLIKFSVYNVTLNELSEAKVWKSEVNAKMALNDYEGALSLAQRPVLLEERIHLLALIAKGKKEDGLSPEPALIEQIRNIYKQIDFSLLGDKAIDIASDLVYSCPDLAIELVETVTQKGQNYNNKKAFSTLTLAAIQQSELTKNTELHIKNPKVHRFISEVTLIINNYSASEVISNVEKFDNVSDRLYLLRQWAINNKYRSDAIEVIEYSLKLSITTTLFAPNARIYREISEPLPFVSDKTRLKTIIGMLDSQKGLIAGPTEDFVELQLLLAQAEHTFDKNASKDRLEDTYLLIIDLEDLSIKCQCLAQLLVSLFIIDDKSLFNRKEDDLYYIVENDFNENINILLMFVGEQFYETRGVVRALAKKIPDMAIDICKRLNTEIRRNAMFNELINSLLAQPIKNVNFLQVVNIVKAITCFETKDVVLDNIMEKVYKEKRDFNLQQLTYLYQLYEEINNMYDIELKCKAYCFFYGVISKLDQQNQGIKNDILSNLEKNWTKMDVEWDKVNVGFNIAGILTEYTYENAKKYIESTQEIRENIELSTAVSGNAYIIFIRLAIMAYSGLQIKSNDTVEDLEYIKKLIKLVPSNSEQASLWSDLALRLYLNNKRIECEKIMSMNVRPLLYDIKFKDLIAYHSLIVDTAPALYKTHSQTTIEIIEDLPRDKKDSAYEKIIQFLISKLPLFEPFDFTNYTSAYLTYEDITDICFILQKIQTDYLIVRFISIITDIVKNLTKKNQITKNQLNEIICKIENIITEKLPDKNNIMHYGYVILAQVYMTKIKKTNSENWRLLIDETEKITNVSDKSFLFSSLASEMPIKEQKKREDLIKKAKDLADTIPTTWDKLDRYETIAYEAWNVNKTFSKKIFEEAMKITLSYNNNKNYPFKKYQHKLIDITYKLDPEFASFLASQIDDDPARIKIKRELLEHMEVLNYKKQITSKRSNTEQFDKKKISHLPHIAWNLLSSLNAGRITPLHIEQTREFVRIASSLSLAESYPIFLWILKNLIVRNANTDQANIFIRPVLVAMLFGAELTLKLAGRTIQQLTSQKSHRPSNIVYINCGERNKAMEAIEEWIKSNPIEYIYICDSYFGPSELEILLLISSYNPNCRVKILTSKKHQNNENVIGDPADYYQNYWRTKVSDQDPPDTEIVVVSVKSSGDSPVHDRWLLTKGSGLRLGSSLNSLGLTKDSEISFLSSEEASKIEEEVLKYINRTEVLFNNEKIRYMSFNL